MLPYNYSEFGISNNTYTRAGNSIDTIQSGNVYINNLSTQLIGNTISYYSIVNAFAQQNNINAVYRYVAISYPMPK